jgi:hypothetical protein
MATSILTAGRMRLDPSLYPPACVDAAATAYAEFLRIESIPSESGALEMSIVTFPAFSAREVQIRREFLNYLLDLSIQRQLKS